MDYYHYRRGQLACEDVQATELAERFGTPLYVYSRRTLEEHVDRITAAFAALRPTICFSVKSCSNLSVLRVVQGRGAGFDIVSGGELARALEIGADPSRVAFAGVGKTDEAIVAALRAGVGWFNVESEEELSNLAGLAERQGVRATVALRVNPDVDAHTHRYTTTGKRSNKFGVNLERVRAVFREGASRPSLDMAGVHVHLGSPINTTEPYVEALERTLELVETLRSDGHRIRAINLGGGFGAHYDAEEAPPAAEYARRIVPMLADRGLEVLLEPGRSIAANAGVLLTRVLYTKQAGDRRIVIVDAAMTDLIRPALYGAFHFVWPVAPAGGLIPPSRAREVSLPECQLVDVVGPVCESGDFLALDRSLPPLRRGDLLCVFTAGAYGFTMSSQYNSRPRAAEVLVEGSTARVIRRRETVDDLLAPERV